MSDRFRLRPARLDDWSSLAALDEEIFGSYGAQEDASIIRARLLTFPQGCVVLEGQRGRGNRFIAGYLTTEKWTTLREPALNEDPRETHDPDGRILNITTLAVAPSCQNQGLGGQLLAQARTIARQESCTQIVLETARAEQFYLRNGFRRLAERTQRGIRLAVLVTDIESTA